MPWRPTRPCGGSTNYNRREERRSQEGLGVLLELAKNIDAQMAESTDKNERQQAAKKIVDAVSQVVRYTSPYKNEALALLKKYKPSVAAKAEELARLTYDDAVAQADEAIASRDWERAIALSRRPSARRTSGATSTRPTRPATTCRSAIT